MLFCPPYINHTLTILKHKPNEAETNPMSTHPELKPIRSDQILFITELLETLKVTSIEGGGEKDKNVRNNFKNSSSMKCSNREKSRHGICCFALSADN